MLIKHIYDLHLNDIRNITVHFENEYDFIIQICGFNSSKLFHFIKHLNELKKENWNKNTKKICIPMKKSHTSIDTIILIAKQLRFQVNSRYGVIGELKLNK